MSFLSNLSIRARMFGAFGITVLITLVIGITGTQATNSQANAIASMYDNQLIPIKDLSNANMQALYINRNLYDYVIETEKAGMDKLKERIAFRFKNYHELMNAYKSSVLVSEEKVLLEKLEAAWPAYIAASEKAMQFSYNDQKKEAIEIVNGEATTTFKVVDDLLSDLVSLNAKVAKEVDEKSSANAAQTLNIEVAAITVAVVLSALLALTITNSVTRPLSQAVRVAEAVASGDLTTPIEIQGQDELAKLLTSMRNMKDGLVKVVANVRSGSEGVATASSQIAQGNQDLSSRTESQASALEETAASMEELSATVKQNADSARQANQLALSASTVAVKGGAVVGEVVETMKGINEASRKISDIISVIDGIAFQTNILALNAAVEAARAGEQGRGFAVVASEVRSLAGRSAEAAKEIKTLINASVQRVEQGTSLVDQAGVTMTEVVSSIKRVTDLMGEISAASNEQAAGVEQVGEAVQQMDQVTQQNAALVEEMAAAAGSLRTQATELVQVVAIFKLDGAGYATAAATPSFSTARMYSAAKGINASPKPVQRKSATTKHVAIAAAKLPGNSTATAEAAGGNDWETF